jgi:hypothetical protein
MNMTTCIKRDFDKVGIDPWEPSYAVPVINGKLTIRDLAEHIDESQINVVEDQNNLYKLIYRDTVQSDIAENVIKLPNQEYNLLAGLTFTKNNSLNAGTPITDTYSEKSNFLAENDQKLVYANLKGGTLKFTLTTNLPHNIDIKLTIPSLTKDGSQYSQVLTYNYSGQGTTNTIVTGDLSGYKLDLSGNGNETNKLTWEAEVNFKPTGNTSVGNESVALKLDITDLKFSLLYGDIGTYTFPEFNGKVKIDIFENASQGEIVFNDPRLKFEVDNNIGAPIGFEINQFETKTDYGQVVQLTSSGSLKIPGPNSLLYPSIIGEKALTTYTLNKTNSNIVEAFKPAPSQLNYAVVPKIVSDGTKTNFIQDKSQIKVYAEAEIPLDATVKIYRLTDTIMDIDLPDNDYIEYALIKIKNSNTLPVDVQIQGYWLDDNNQIIDSLLLSGSKLINSGPIDQNGNVLSPGIHYQEENYDKARYDKIKKSKKLLIAGDLKSSNEGNTPVKFYSYSELKLQVSVLVNGKVEF